MTDRKRKYLGSSRERRDFRFKGVNTDQIVLTKNITNACVIKIIQVY